MWMGKLLRLQMKKVVMKKMLMLRRVDYVANAGTDGRTDQISNLVDKWVYAKRFRRQSIFFFRYMVLYCFVKYTVHHRSFEGSPTGAGIDVSTPPLLWHVASFRVSPRSLHTYP